MRYYVSGDMSSRVKTVLFEVKFNIQLLLDSILYICSFENKVNESSNSRKTILLIKHRDIHSF